MAKKKPYYSSALKRKFNNKNFHWYTIKRYKSAAIGVKKRLKSYGWYVRITKMDSGLYNIWYRKTK